MSQKKYWSSFDELNNTPAFQKAAQNEFAEDLPFAEDGSLLEAKTDRRDFLKYLGFSTAAVTIASSCEMPVRKAIPYAIKPEDIIPGVAQRYASTFVDGADALPIIFKNRDGRPIKIEGNSKSTISEGSTNARVQASVLNLYDTNRLRFPQITKKESSYNDVDIFVKKSLAGKSILLTPSIHGVSNKSIIETFLTKYPGVRHIQMDGTSYSGVLDANLESYGKREIPLYRFDLARNIVSIGADFLGSWVAPAIFAKQYSKGRKISAQSKTMSKHIQFEGMMSMTGANSDERFVCKPSEYGKIAIALLDVLNGKSANIADPKVKVGVEKAAKALSSGSGVVVCGSNDKSVQTVVNAINSKIGANGSTIDFGKSFNYKANDLEIIELVDSINAGGVETLITIDSNPIYFLGSHLKDVISKVKNKISISDRLDETAELCDVNIPLSHFLESWGDAEVAGSSALIQPAIAPIFKSRSWQDCLLKWSESETNHADYFKNYWTSKSGSETAFNEMLQNGGDVAELTAPTGASFSGGLDTSISLINSQSSKEEYELIIYSKVSIGHGGNWSANPWLQEMADPITRATWGNYVMMSPTTAKTLGAEENDINEVDANKKVFKVSVGKDSVSLPVAVIPGMHDKVVAIATGFGRSAGNGMASKDLGANINVLVPFVNSSFQNSVGVKVEATSETATVAKIQTHNSYESRPIIHEFSLPQFSANPNELREERFNQLKPFIAAYKSKEHGEGEKHNAAHTEAGHADGGHHKLWSFEPTIETFEEDFRKEATMYPHWENPGAKWAMSIDLNSCIGCGACTVACQAENNVSVVGKDQVILMHDMEWIRIDRYFSGNPSDPSSIETVFQPMLCQHCDNAPCENVCPVNATNHSSEGLNQMAYNRCIGTRYCANNCPYKVRRFNWRDWNGADSFSGNSYSDGRRDDINDDLTRMVLNPDVVVRSRGVMEKCTFCTQRLQEGKLTAKKENRALTDGDIMTACQQSCPTNAIVFGNIHDEESTVSKIRNKDQKERVFYALEDIHVLPSVNYLSKIRNKDTDLMQEGHLGKEKKASHHSEEAHK